MEARVAFTLDSAIIEELQSAETHVSPQGSIDGDTKSSSSTRATPKLSIKKKRGKTSEATSKYFGVYWHKRDKKWQSKIKIKGKLVYLGYAKEEEEAAHLYDKRARMEGLATNFLSEEDIDKAEESEETAHHYNKRARMEGLATNLLSKDMLNGRVNATEEKAAKVHELKGVSWEKGRKKWQAQITWQGKDYSLGRHTDRGFAVRVYDFYAKMIGYETNYNDTDEFWAKQSCLPTQHHLYNIFNSESHTPDTMFDR